MSYATVRIAPSWRVKAACYGFVAVIYGAMLAVAIGCLYAAYLLLALVCRLIEVAKP